MHCPVPLVEIKRFHDDDNDDDNKDAEQLGNILQGLNPKRSCAFIFSAIHMPCPQSKWTIRGKKTNVLFNWCIFGLIY